MDYNTSDLLDKVMDGDHLGAKDIFKNIMGDRVIAELGAKKIEMARTLLPSSEKPSQEIAVDKAKELNDQLKDEDF
tara:strand:+ start:1177 stop:1404 length:228 start_codon:yes stop_codon:yes gene_type:complete